MAKSKEQKIAEAEARRKAAAERQDVEAGKIADLTSEVVNAEQPTGDGSTVEAQSVPSPPRIAVGPHDGTPDPLTVETHVQQAVEQASADAAENDLTDKQAEKAIAKAAREEARQVVKDAREEAKADKTDEPAVPYRSLATGPIEPAEDAGARPAEELAVRYPNIAVGPIPD